VRVSWNPFSPKGTKGFLNVDKSKFASSLMIKGRYPRTIFSKNQLRQSSRNPENYKNPNLTSPRSMPRNHLHLRMIASPLHLSSRIMRRTRRIRCTIKPSENSILGKSLTRMSKRNKSRHQLRSRPSPNLMLKYLQAIPQGMILLLRIWCSTMRAPWSHAFIIRMEHKLELSLKLSWRVKARKWWWCLNSG
jgi:hypothetical protein